MTTHSTAVQLGAVLRTLEWMIEQGDDEFDPRQAISNFRIGLGPVGNAFIDSDEVTDRFEEGIEEYLAFSVVQDMLEQFIDDLLLKDDDLLDY